MFPKITQAYPFYSVVCNQIAGRLGEKHLPSMSGAHNACGTVDIQAHIPFGHARRFTSMQTHAYAHRHTLRPGISGECALCSHGSRERITGASKDGKNGIPLRIDLVPSLLLESTSQQCTARGQQLAVAITELMEQLC